MNNTYIIFSTRKIIGPVYFEFINEVIRKKFKSKPFILEEETFRLKYPEQYKKEFEKNWTDYVSHKIINLSYIGPFMINTETPTVFNHWFNITKMNDKVLLFTYSHDADLQYIGELLLVLNEYVSKIFKIQIGPRFYISKTKDQISLGQQAVTDYLVDSTCYSNN